MRVFDLLEAKSTDKAVTEGACKVVGVIHKDAKNTSLPGSKGDQGFAKHGLTERAVGSTSPAGAISAMWRKWARTSA